MARMSQFIIVISIGIICLGNVQSDTEFQRNYIVPRMLERIGNDFSASQDFRSVSIDVDVPSIFNRLKEHISDQVLKDFLTVMEENKCVRDFEYSFTNWKSKDMFQLEMLDAFGKPGPGILEGNLRWIGNYHECTSIYVPPNENSTAGDFNGQYCNLDLSIGISDLAIPLTLGVCLPDSCSSLTLENYKEMFSLVSYGPWGLEVNVTQKTCQATSRELTSPAVAVICLLSFFVLFSVIGSSIRIYEYFFTPALPEDDTLRRYIQQIQSQVEDGEPSLDSSSNAALIQNERERKGWLHQMKAFFNCFCVFTNGEKLLNTDSTEGQLLCLHGIRFLSMTWVIVGHTYLSVLTAVGNLLETVTVIDTWLFQIILNGFYSVDSFFLLSGFLVAYLFFQESAKPKGNISWLYFYIHRFIRLTPVYMIVLGYEVALSYYSGSGPFWTTNVVEPVCRDNWWYNILYINNFASSTEQCMGWSWYLANDMQFFIISPIFLVTLWRWPTVGFSLLGLFMSATVAANFGITYHYSLHQGYDSAGDVTDIDIQALMDQQSNYFENIYIKPYTRMSPYLVGIALAYLVFQRRQNNSRKLSWVTLICGWIVASGISLACLFCLYHRRLSLVESGFYNGLGHASFAVGLGWVIFTCLNGQGGPVDRILSFKLFIPLSRLTYCAYLIHPLVLGTYFGSLKVLLQFSHLTMVTTYLGLLLMTYAFSFVVSVLFESPIIRLDKLVRTRLS